LYLILIALMLSPLYLWKSGLPQASHILAAVAVGYRYTITKPKQFYFEKAWLLQVFFLAYSFLVAVIVYIAHSDINTLLAPLYYLFGFIIYVEILTIYAERGKKFLTYVLLLHIIVLFVVTACSLSGIGRSIISASDGVRMMLAFNNPNQLANWAIWFVVIISCTGRAVYRTWLPGLLSLVVASVLIFYSLSRSGFVGIAVLVAFYAALGLKNLRSWYINYQNRSMKRFLLIITIIVLSLIVLVMVVMMLNYLDNASTGIADLDKIVNRVVNTDFNRQINLRGYDRLWKYPEYLFFGAGEGARGRFAEKTAFVKHEVHSTWAGLLFNYGLVGFALFSGFIISILKKIKLIWFKLILLAPFFFGFTNYNVRNWYFWVGLALVYGSALLMQEDEYGEPRSGLIDVGVLAKNVIKKMESILNRLFKKEKTTI